MSKPTPFFKSNLSPEQFSKPCTQYPMIQLSPQAQKDSENLRNVHQAIASFFSYPVIDEMTLDAILDACLDFPQVAIYLSDVEPESVEYYLKRYHVIEAIKNHIKSYIDGKTSPSPQ